MDNINPNDSKETLSKTPIQNFVIGIIVILIFVISQSIFAQVGVGNTNPQAQLDISASSTSSPTNLDGILIPRMSNLPSTGSMTANQDGMLVFYTGTGNSGKGFYYWDNNLGAWQFIIGAKRIDELNDGISDGSSVFLGTNSGINDNGGGNGNTGIGTQSLQQNTSGASNTAVGQLSLNANTQGFANTAVGESSLSSNTTGSGNIGIGTTSLITNSIGSSNIGIGLSALQNNDTGNSNIAIGGFAGRNTNASGNVIIGDLALEQNTSGGNNIVIGNSAANQSYNASGSVFIGNQAGYNETNGNRLYIENSDADSDNALLYGEFNNDILRVNGELQVNNPSGTGYTLPTSDGTSNQIITTDGFGALSFVDASSIFTNSANTLDDAYNEGGAGAGRTINANNGRVEITGNDGMSISRTDTNDNTEGLRIYTNLDGNGSSSIHNNFWGDAGAGTFRTATVIDNYIRTLINDGTIYGLRNSFVLGNNSGGANNTGNIGVYNHFYSGTNSGFNIGVDNDFILPASSHYGIKNSKGSFTSGTTYGMHNDFDNNNSSIIYGSYNDILATGTGSVYGTYNSFNGGGSGNKYGTYTNISTAGSGIHYGIYANVQKTDSYAAYFIGRASLGTGTTNRYLMPETAGSTNQIMAIDNTGQVNFVDSSSVFTDSDTTYDGTDFALSNQSLAAGQYVTGISSTGTLISGTDQDNQNLTSATLVGTTLNLAIENGTGTSVNLASLQDGTGTDNQTIDNFSLSGTTLRLSLEDDGQPLQVVNLASLQDGTGSDNQNLTSASLVGTTLNLGIEDGTGTSVNLASLQDGIGTDNQTVDNFSLSGTTLRLSLEDDGQPLQTVNLASLQDGTGSDDQNIESLNFNSSTNILTVGIENGSSDTVDLSALDSNDWSLSGNSGTNPTTNFIGTIDNQELSFRINNNQRMRLTAKGQLEMTNGSNSLFIGEQAGENDNLTDNRNTFIGYQNGFTSIGGQFNTSIGYQGMYNNNGGSYNMAVGNRSLYFNSSGNYNTGIGFRTLYNNTSGAHNIGIGVNALYNSQTNNNSVSIGSYSLTDNVTGSDNVAIGFRAGDADTSSSQNVYIGTRSGAGGVAAETKSGNIFIGYRSGYNESGSNKLYIENSDSSSPLVYGEFDNNILRANGELQVGVPAGTGYAFPTTDGTANQVLTTNGAGGVAWQTPTNGDILGVNAGAGITGGGTTGTVTVTAAANNGLNVDAGADRIQWGGTLTEDTTITYGAFDTRFNLNNSGDFIIQDNGTGVLEVNDAGNSVFGRDVYFRDANTSGTLLGLFTDDANDGRFRIYENGIASVDLDANTQFVFNEQGLDRDFRVESAGNANMFRVDASTNRVGIGGFPGIDFHVFHGNSGTTSGMRLQNTNNNNWIRMYVSSSTGDLRFFSTSQAATSISNINDVSGVYTATSDRRLKKDFEDLYFSWDNFMDLQPLTYKYKADDEAKNYIGMVAQDVKKIYPELISYHQEGDVYHMDYGATGVVAIKAVQELKIELDTLKEENAILKAKLKKMTQLEARLSAIEKTINHVATNNSVSSSADE